MKISVFKYISKEEVIRGNILKDDDIIERKILPKFCRYKLIKYIIDDGWELWDNPYIEGYVSRAYLSECHRIWYKNEYVYDYDVNYKTLDIGDNYFFDENTIPRKIENELLGKDICREEDVYLLTKYINPEIKEQFMKEIYPFFVEGETFIWLDEWN